MIEIELVLSAVFVPQEHGHMHALRQMYLQRHSTVKMQTHTPIHTEEYTLYCVL